MSVFTLVTEHFDALFDSLAQAVFCFDRNARICCTNRAFSALTGHSAESNADLTVPALLRIFSKSIDLAKIVPPYHITELGTAGGGTVPVLISYQKLYDVEQECAGCLACVTDLREARSKDAAIAQLSLENEALRKAAGGAPDEALREQTRLMREAREANEFLDNVIESCGDGIMIVDDNGRIIRVNSSFAGMLDLDKPDLEGKYVHQLGPAAGSYQSTTGETIVIDKTYNDYQASMVEYFSDSASHGTLPRWNFHVFNRAGQLVPLELTITFQRDRRGAIVGGVGAARNITERLIAEREIRDANTFLENVIEACGDGICIVDNQAVVTRVNESFAHMLGKAKSDIEGHLIFDLGPRDGTFRTTTGETIELDTLTRPNHMGRLEKFFQHGDDLTIENWRYYARHADGDLVPLDMTITFQMDPEGNLNGAVCTARDITDQLKAQKALQDAYRFRTDFFTNITHEFRTPLTLAIGPLEGILSEEHGPIPEPLRDHVALALRSSRQLLKLVNQLLDVSRLEAGGKHVMLEQRNLPAFLEAVLEFFRLMARKKQIELTFSAPADMPPVAIDPGKLEKVLFNLVGNAFKFTPDQGRITVVLERIEAPAGTPAAPAAAEWIRITVSDTGCGIRQEHLADIFDRFKQAGTSPGQPGSGIGLAHARELVDLMGGRLSAESTYSKGASFFVDLPVTSHSPSEQLTQLRNEIELQPEVELADVPAGPPPDSVSGTKPLVLIVDDNPDIVQYVARSIAESYDYITAAQGREGLEKLAAHVPDIILCDVMMPVMDGYGFLRAVRQQAAGQATPFIFLTAKADIEMKAEGIEQGADDYIVKPFNARELRARLAAQLRVRELLTQTRAQEKTIQKLSRKLQSTYAFGNIIGTSPAMQKIYAIIETLRESNASVLISGETGTGKELIANAVHFNSPRAAGPLVSVNCGAIPRELMEREFFGHVKGAFTGAVATRKGYFEEAHGGTLFLDEIGEMDKGMQVKLLRVLERGEVTRIGDTVPKQVDVRLVAATNKNLLAEVATDRFREDLYYRIHVIPVHLPPLRQRPDDIPLLIEHFLQDFAKRAKQKPLCIPPRHLRLFMKHPYPGNVRELKHLLERYCLMGGSVEGLFTADAAGHPAAEMPFDPDDIFASTKPLKAAAQQARARAERAVLLQALETCAYDYKQAAARLGICQASLYNKIKEYNITRPANS